MLMVRQRATRRAIIATRMSRVRRAVDLLYKAILDVQVRT